MLRASSLLLGPPTRLLGPPTGVVAGHTGAWASPWGRGSQLWQKEAAGEEATAGASRGRRPPRRRPGFWTVRDTEQPWTCPWPRLQKPQLEGRQPSAAAHGRRRHWQEEERETGSRGHAELTGLEPPGSARGLGPGGGESEDSADCRHLAHPQRPPSVTG